MNLMQILVKCGTPADSYQIAWSSYTAEKEKKKKRLGNKKKGGCANGKELEKQQD